MLEIRLYVVLGQELVIMGGDECLRGPEFESQHHTLPI